MKPFVSSQSKQLKKPIMKAEQILETITNEVAILWQDVEDFTRILGSEHESTKRVIARWSAVNELLIKLSK